MIKKKIVWICHFSNDDVRSHLRFGIYPLDMLRKMTGRPTVSGKDFAVWNTYAVKEIEKFDDIELSVIMPHKGMKQHHQEFTINGVRYYCFRSEDDSIWWHVNHFNDSQPDYNKNRKYIKDVIERTHPDLVHVIGAENPHYGLAVLDIPPSIPVIVSLQTLISDSEFPKNYPMSPKLYEYRKQVEQEIIQRADYIGTKVAQFRDIIKSEIKTDVVFLNISIATGIEVHKEKCEKFFDFVYFAANINKSADEAIEAFALACKKRPEMTMDISGNYDADFKTKLDKRISELGIAKNISFSGSKKSHNDVLFHIMKAKYALLPLKVDQLSGTIRESMACGIPVITTITPVTPKLNIDRKCVLLAPKGDVKAMSEQMLELFDNQELGETLRRNAYLTVEEKYSNKRIMNEVKSAYFQILQEKSK